MRVSTVLLALSCLVTGYSLAGARVNATEDVYRRFPAGVGTGTHVRLTFSSEPNYVDCTIERIDGGWLRCAPPDDPFRTYKVEEIWYDVSHVVTVTKVETQR